MSLSDAVLDVKLLIKFTFVTVNESLFDSLNFFRYILKSVLLLSLMYSF